MKYGYLLLALILVPIVSGMYTDKQIYIPGDIIAIYNATQLEVFTPENSYTLLGQENNVWFQARELGTYIFRDGEEQQAVRVLPEKELIMRTARGAAVVHAANENGVYHIPSPDADHILVRNTTVNEIRISPNLAARWGFVRTFAVDPTIPGFGSAELTYTARGDSLFKCEEYDYFSQTCDGSWRFIRPLIPGEQYTVIVSGDDPVFGEGDGESQPDKCRFSDDAGAGDGDTNVNCLAEVVTQNNGQTADLQDPEQGGGGASSIRINFTNSLSVASINSVSVTTRYQRVTNTEVGGTTATLQVFDAGAWTTACTDTVLIGNWESFPCSLATWVTTEAELNQIQFRILFNTAKSGKGDSEGTVWVDYTYVAADYVYLDKFEPTYSGIIADKPSPKSFNGDPTNFTVTWNDDVAVDVVFIEHNFSGALQNTTVAGGPVYTYATLLPPGNYTWRQIANDTVNNLNNSMPNQEYIVTKGTGTIELLLNGSAQNLTINEDRIISINGTRLTGEGSMTLYENGAPLGSGTNIDVLKNYSEPGTYLIELNMSATQNYTAAHQEFTLTVNDITPPGAVTNLDNRSAGESWIYWEWNNPDNLDFSQVIVLVNGTFFENTSTNFSNVTGLSSDTLYEIQLRTVDSSGNINQTTIVDLGRTKVSFDIRAPSLTNIRNGTMYDSTTTILWDTDEIADSRVKYGTTKGSHPLEKYLGTDVSLHNVSLTGLIPTTTYFYVVNSTDPAGNSNQSAEFNFTTGPDITPPLYSKILASPASPKTFPVTVTFNTTWTDNAAVDVVVLEHNFSGVWTNSTVSGGAVYSYMTALAAGTYGWHYHANDTIGNRNDAMPVQTYIVNRATPSLTLTLNGTNGNFAMNEDTSLRINGSVGSGEGVVELLQNQSLLQLGYGERYLIKSYTKPGAYNISFRHNQTQNYSLNEIHHLLIVHDTTAPNVTLIQPFGGKTITVQDVKFSAISDDNNRTESCTLLIDGTDNLTNSSVTDGSPVYFSQSFADGQYNWSVRCVDPAGNSATTAERSFSIANIPAWIPTLATHNIDGVVTAAVNASGGTVSQLDDGENVTTTTWSGTAPSNANISAVQASCELSFAERGERMYFAFTTISGYSGLQCVTPQDSTGVFTCDLYSLGVDTVAELNSLQLTCVVHDANGGPAARGDLDYMEILPSWSLIERPDFIVLPGNLSLPAGYGENVIVPIHANVSNIGDVGATVVVRFVDKTRDIVIASPSAVLDAGTWKQFNASWNAEMGRTNITVILDPAGTIIELNETNNNVSDFLDVQAWHSYYGSTVNRFHVLGTGGSREFNWTNSELQGNIFVTDLDASVSMLNLQALTRTTTDSFAFSDLADADAKLGMTGWIDSILATFSNGTDLYDTATFTVFGVTIDQVPVINSTLNNTFITGILYDVDDDTNGGYDGEEDLVFITRVNLSQIGTYGTYDYEITIPAPLRNDSGFGELVYLFIEVT